MRITIVGGGTAGWITALLANARLPRATVTVVESPEIGILGAGEGTTPHFVGAFLDVVGIPLSALVRECGATLKSGIRFHNWRGDGTSYLHPFMDRVFSSFDLAVLDPADPLPLEALNVPAHATGRGRAPLSPRPPEERRRDVDPMLNLVPQAGFAAHFDAVRLARFLARVARERGVQHIEGKVTDVIPDPRGFVDRLVLEEGGSVPGDLFFDCTGFRRVLLGQHFHVPWIDVAGTLPVNSAIPFALPLDGPRIPQTDAIALDAGWAWRIPVEGRYGCGYVYDANYASDEEARATIRRAFGPDIQMPKILRFRAGYLERIWVKNVVGVGLSSGFLEPLEATSIWASILTLAELFKVHLAQNDDIARRSLNRFHRTLQERIVDFLYLHYLGGRSDTPFWRGFVERTDAPAMSARILEEGFRWPFDEDPLFAGNPAPFSATSWLYVALGIGRVDWPSMHRYWDYFGLREGAEDRIAERTRIVREVGAACVPHEELIATLGGRAVSPPARSTGSARTF